MANRLSRFLPCAQPAKSGLLETNPIFNADIARRIIPMGGGEAADLSLPLVSLYYFQFGQYGSGLVSGQTMLHAHNRARCARPNGRRDLARTGLSDAENFDSLSSFWIRILG